MQLRISEVTYIRSRTASEISQIIGQIFGVDGGERTHSGYTCTFRNAKFGRKKLEKLDASFMA